MSTPIKPLPPVGTARGFSFQEAQERCASEVNALLVVHGQKTSLDGSTLVWRMSDGRTFQMLFARDGIDWAIYPPQAITSQGSYPAALFTGKYGPPNYPGNRFDPHRVIDFLRSKTSTQEVGRCTDKCMRPNTL